MSLDPIFSQTANENVIAKTQQALIAHGIDTFVFDTIDEVRENIVKSIPKGSEVFTISSETLRLGGIAKAINESGKYISVRKALTETTDLKQKRKIGAAPDYAIGSVHALTEDGHLWIVSATGSQLASCAYGAQHVIYVVGAQKIVKDDAIAMKRVYEYTLPKESERTLKIFGNPSKIGKLLVIHDDKPGRTTVYIVKEAVGF